MDKFLSGFGFGTMSSSSPTKPPDAGQSLNAKVNTSPQKEPAKFMGQASKVIFLKLNISRLHIAYIGVLMYTHAMKSVFMRS